MEYPSSPNERKSDEDVVRIANDLSKRLGGSLRVDRYNKCDDEYFAFIYEELIGEKLAGFCIPAGLQDRISNCQCIIDSVAKEVLNVDLSHITGMDIISGDKLAISNLLEIFVDLVDLISEEAKQESTDTKDLDDSDALTEDHDILSDVMLEEFGTRIKTSSKVFPTDESGTEEYVTDSADQQQKRMSGLPATSAIGDSGTLTPDSLEERDIIDLSSASSLDEPSDGPCVRSEVVPISVSVRQRPHRMTGLPIPDEVSSSFSSASWSHVLLPTGGLTAAAESTSSRQPNFSDVGVRPRQPFPGEHSPAIDTATAAKQVVHQHTHYHYHQPDTSCSPKSTASDGSDKQRDGSDAVVSRLPSSRPTRYDAHHNDLRESGRNDATTVMPIAPQSDQLSSSSNHHTKSPLSSHAVPDPVGRPQRSSDLRQLEERLKDIRQSVQQISKAQSVGMASSDYRRDHGMTTETQMLPRPVVPTTSTRQPAVSFVSASHLNRQHDTLPSISTDDDELVSGYSSDPQSIASDRQPRLSRRSKATILRSILRDRREMTSDASDESEDDGDNHTPLANARRHAKPLVHFKDDLRTYRDERLAKARQQLDRERKKASLDFGKVKSSYTKDFRHAKEATQQLRNSIGKENCQKEAVLSKELSQFKPAKRKQLTAGSKGATRLSRVYANQSSKVRPVTKQRKRSASSSPVSRRRMKAPLVLAEEEILPVMQEEFPFLYMSPQTAKLMWRRQMRQLSSLAKTSLSSKPTRTQKQIEAAEKKQNALVKLVKKELECNKRMLVQKREKEEESAVASKLRDRRHASARARKYYDEYQLKMKSKMVQRKTREEQIFKGLFDDALEIQKQRIHELRDFAKEQRESTSQRQQDQIESLENFYRDQFAMLADDIMREREDLKTRQQAQTKVVHEMRTTFRKRMEKDIRDIQDQLIRDDDTAHFRQLDANALRSRFQLATYRMLPK